MGYPIRMRIETETVSLTPPTAVAWTVHRERPGPKVLQGSMAYRAPGGLKDRRGPQARQEPVVMTASQVRGARREQMVRRDRLAPTVETARTARTERTVRQVRRELPERMEITASQVHGVRQAQMVRRDRLAPTVETARTARQVRRERRVS